MALNLLFLGVIHSRSLQLQWQRDDHRDQHWPPLGHLELHSRTMRSVAIDIYLAWTSNESAEIITIIIIS